MQFLLPERVRILCHIWGIGQGMQWCLHLCSRLAWPGLVWQPQQLSWVISLCVRNGRKIKQERGGEGGAELEQEQSRQQKAAGKGKQARPRDAGQKKWFRKTISARLFLGSEGICPSLSFSLTHYPSLLPSLSCWSVNWRIAYFCNLFALQWNPKMRVPWQPIAPLHLSLFLLSASISGPRNTILKGF